MARVDRTQRRGKRSREGDDSRFLLAKLGSLFDSGHFDEAIALGESMLGLSGSASFRGRICLDLAMAYLQLGKPDLAIAPLAEAKGHFEADKDIGAIVECMAAEASIACSEHRRDALEVASAALLACRRLRNAPSGLELRILSTLASTQLLVGQKSEAIDTFEKAIKRADPILDMRQLGKLFGNAAIAYRDIGQLEKAIKYSRRAVALFETLRDLVSLALEENNLGCYLIAFRELTSARKHLERSRQLFEQADVLNCHLLLSLCELCFAEGNLTQAVAHADHAIEAGENRNETWSVANARIWKGRIDSRLGDYAGADDEFRIALAVLETSGMEDRLVVCHTEYAEVLEQRGDLPRAYEQLAAAFRIRVRRGTAVRPIVD